MTATATARRAAPSWDVTQEEHAELMSFGFTLAQIQRLAEMRAVYPLIEQIYTKEEMQRLLFLKWLHARWSKVDEQSGWTPDFASAVNTGRSELA